MSARPGKVVFVNRFFFPDESATSQILTDLALHLHDEGASVSVVTSGYMLGGGGDLPRRESVSGVDVRRVRSARWGGRSLVGKLVQFATFYPAAFLELLAMLRPGDVIVAKTDPPLISVVAWVAAKLRGAQLINWLQDLYPEVASELRTPLLISPLVHSLRKIRNLALKRAAMNVVIGECMASKLEAEGISPDAIQVVHNWADEQVLTPIEATRSSLRREWGFESDDFVVGYSGNLGRAHEYETILEAASRLADRSKIKFLLIGGGHEFERLRAKASEQNLGSFHFQPSQPRQRLQETLGAADAHWLSLRPNLEGLIVPSKFYGILAAGRPVLSVTAADGETARIVTRHGCGYAVPPGDGARLAEVIAELADDASLRTGMGHRARLASEGYFSKSSALRRWATVIQAHQQDSLISDQDMCAAPVEALG